MTRLWEKYRPTTLAEVVGQPALRSLKTFAIEPYPTALIFTGDSGTGKTTAAMILAGMLRDEGWFGGTEYKISGAKLTVAAADEYFSAATTPFRYAVAPGKFHVLRIEELERLHPAVQNDLKDSIEEACQRYRVVIIATSNTTEKLEKALLHRFTPYHFSAGKTFGDDFNDWMTKVWEREVGPNVDMPLGWQSFGYEGESFSGRLALDRLEKAIARLRERAGVA